MTNIHPDITYSNHYPKLPSCASQEPELFTRSPCLSPMRQNPFSSIFSLLNLQLASFSLSYLPVPVSPHPKSSKNRGLLSPKFTSPNTRTHRTVHYFIHFKFPLVEGQLRKKKVHDSCNLEFVVKQCKLGQRKGLP